MMAKSEDKPHHTRSRAKRYARQILEENAPSLRRAWQSAFQLGSAISRKILQVTDDQRRFLGNDFNARRAFAEL